VARIDLIGLASRVSDGEAVDWQQAGRATATPEEERIVCNLKLVERVARVHRESPAPARSDTSSTRTLADRPAPIGTTPGPGSALPMRWGPLEIRGRIGEGGFGEVFLAWDPTLRREVALKLLKPDLSSRRSLASRVVREGRLLARVSHPNVITVHGAESHAGRLGLWMELVRGRSLDDAIRDDGPLGPREAALIGIDLCRALAAVHRAGLVHRDVKAQNVMRQTGGRILLMDFGAGSEASAEDQDTVSGTPLYMAPEIHAGAKATPQSDLYSLGVLLYHLVTGAYPISARNAADLREKVRRREMRLLRDERPDLPEDFVRVVDRALAWDPRDRFATPGLLEQALAATLGTGTAPDPSVVDNRLACATRRMAGWAAAGVGILVIVLLIVKAQVRQAAAPPAAATYTVEAALYRVGGTAQRERLQSGDRLALGDNLSLEFRASRDIHLYVINEDERGHAYALFPLPNLDLKNPLPAGRTHVIPGTLGGRSRSWVVDTAGGREHLLLLASPDRLVEFEAGLSRLPRPGPDGLAVLIPESVKVRLRGIGALGDGGSQGGGSSAAGPLFDLAERLAGPSENAAGAWLRRIDLDNPE